MYYKANDMLSNVRDCHTREQRTNREAKPTNVLCNILRSPAYCSGIAQSGKGAMFRTFEAKGVRVKEICQVLK